jgi:hypothetical protein
MFDFAPSIPNVISQVTPMILDVNPLETVEKHFNVQLGQTILR